MLAAEVEWRDTPQGEANQQRRVSSVLWTGSVRGGVGAREEGKEVASAKVKGAGVGVGGIWGRGMNCGRMGLPGAMIGSEGDQYVLIQRNFQA